MIPQKVSTILCGNPCNRKEKLQQKKAPITGALQDIFQYRVDYFFTTSLTMRLLPCISST